MVGQDPARFRRSTTATRFPCEASDQAKDLALPLPSTTTSYSSGCDTFSPFQLLSLRQRSHPPWASTMFASNSFTADLQEVFHLLASRRLRNRGAQILRVL